MPKCENCKFGPEEILGGTVFNDRIEFNIVQKCTVCGVGKAFLKVIWKDPKDNPNQKLIFALKVVDISTQMWMDTLDSLKSEFVKLRERVLQVIKEAKE